MNLALDERIESFLPKRFEFKYLLDPKTAHLVETYVQKMGCARDEYSALGPYPVNSLYFDTVLLDDYRDKDGSFLIRKKLRARVYQESWQEPMKNVWIEIKRKRNMTISKVRIKVDGVAWQKFIKENNPLYLITDGLSEEERSGLKEFAYLYRRHLYRPHAMVHYERTAYLDRFLSKVRISFDKNIRVCFAGNPAGENFMVPVSKDRVIMELKYNEKVPWWVTDMVIRFGLKRTDFSKYRNSVAVLRGFYHLPIKK